MSNILLNTINNAIREKHNCVVRVEAINTGDTLLGFENGFIASGVITERDESHISVSLDPIFKSRFCIIKIDRITSIIIK